MITTSRYKVVAGELSGVRRVDQGGLIVNSHEPTQREGTRTPAPFHTHGYTRHLSHSLARSHWALGRLAEPYTGDEKAKRAGQVGRGRSLLVMVGLCLSLAVSPPPCSPRRVGSWKRGAVRVRGGGLLSTNLFPYPITRPSRNRPNRARVGKEHKSHGELPAPAVEGGERRE